MERLNISTPLKKQQGVREQKIVPHYVQEISATINEEIGHKFDGLQMYWEINGRKIPNIRQWAKDMGLFNSSDGQTHFKITETQYNRYLYVNVKISEDFMRSLEDDKITFRFVMKYREEGRRLYTIEFWQFMRNGRVARKEAKGKPALVKGLDAVINGQGEVEVNE